MKRVLVLDSYDSFVYNLVQYLGELGADPLVYRNDALTVEQALALQPDAVLLSPGPGRPEDAGILCAAIPAFATQGIPVLGVCLGHQTIGDCHGMMVRRNDIPVHGKTSPLEHDGRGIFAGLSQPFVATRYHSLVVDRETVGDEFEISAWTARGEVMALRWKAPVGQAPMDGVQFHPESFLTIEGPRLLGNFLQSRAVTL